MKKFGIIAAAMMWTGVTTTAFSADLIVGVSWSNFQEERWKTDEAAIKSALEDAGVHISKLPAKLGETIQKALD